MAITQEVNIEMLEKLPDGNFKAKYPKTKAENIIDLARYATTTGSVNTYVASIEGVTALVAGLRVTVKINVANTGASTINVSGLGAKSIRKSGGTVLSAGNLKAAGVYSLVYDGTNFILQGEGGEYGTAAAPDVLLGKTVGTDNGLVAGIMPNIGKQTGTVISNNGQIAINKGYHDGTGAIKALLANLVAENIKKDVNVGGVIGTLEHVYSQSGSIPKETKFPYDVLQSFDVGFAPDVIIIKYGTSADTQLCLTIKPSRIPNFSTGVINQDIKIAYGVKLRIGLTPTGFSLIYKDYNSTSVGDLSYNLDWVAFKYN